MFGPQPRSYEFDLPKKVRRGALARGARAEGQRRRGDRRRRLERAISKTKTTAEMFKRLGATGKTLVIDVKPDEGFTRSARNIAGVTLVASNARDRPRRHRHGAHRRDARRAREAPEAC